MPGPVTSPTWPGAGNDRECTLGGHECTLGGNECTLGGGGGQARRCAGTPGFFALRVVDRRERADGLVERDVGTCDDGRHEAS